MKNVEKNNLFPFEVFTAYDQEVISGYYDEGNFFMDGIYPQNGPK